MLRRTIVETMPSKHKLPKPSDPPKRHLLHPKNGRLAYTDHGSGPHVAVAIHGGPGSTFDFRYLGACLEPHIRLIRVDLPGYGESSPSPKGAHGQALAEAVLDLCNSKELQINDKVFLIGHSLGGEVAMKIASAHPERVAGVAFVNSIGISPNWTLRRKRVIQWTTRTMDHPYIGRAVKSLLTKVYTHALGFKSKHLTSAEIFTTQRRAAAVDFDVQRRNAARLKDLQIPTLTAYSADDPVVEEPISRELAEALAHGHCVVFKSGGHFIQKWHAQPLGNELIQWMHNVRRT
eukprot:TRINITY_DN11649_c0_g1_i1.p1 TRINITY_DN11649_c0_g1~~TRINITY_DN11649_c0_g1_i1.p1  ORF type:complete len:291 (-),score=33.02 TRINITY_DN11649_c0_g1_i1:96-968(-)